ncbi:DUF6230 family protein [Streptomyces sp. 8L]|uniref:DUF6230 family protein n=1 Tax=unclassified Streptomyces TaxID=2593676 RepID=UPI001CD63992|nr:DUF6230 family protein [Streptomyces sp. 8L]MCA1222297.1 DUF6230 family protein [Streptomyces sp. 8L]
MAISEEPPRSDTEGAEASSPSPARRGRVRFRRAAIMGVPAAAIAATLVVLTAQGAIAAQFAISGMPFVVAGSSLEGTGFGQFGGLDNMADNSPNAGDTGGQELVIVSAFRHAEITDLCQSVALGGTYLHLTAGTKAGHKVQADTLTTDSTDIAAQTATFGDIEIGGDASTFDKPPVKGPLGVFGQQADTANLQGFRQTNYATTAAKFTLPNLHMSFAKKGC